MPGRSDFSGVLSNERIDHIRYLLLLSPRQLRGFFEKLTHSTDRGSLLRTFLSVAANEFLNRHFKNPCQCFYLLRRHRRRVTFPMRNGTLTHSELLGKLRL